VGLGIYRYLACAGQYTNAGTLMVVCVCGLSISKFNYIYFLISHHSTYDILRKLQPFANKCKLGSLIKLFLIVSVLKTATVMRMFLPILNYDRILLKIIISFSFIMYELSFVIQLFAYSVLTSLLSTRLRHLRRDLRKLFSGSKNVTGIELVELNKTLVQINSQLKDFIKVCSVPVSTSLLYALLVFCFTCYNILSTGKVDFQITDLAEVFKCVLIFVIFAFETDQILNEVR